MGAGIQRWWRSCEAACDEFDGVASRTVYADRIVTVYVNGARDTQFNNGCFISQGPTSWLTCIPDSFARTRCRLPE